MTRQLVLSEGEELRWEGRPAPRCYTFRNWRQSLFGAVFLVFCSVWQGLSLGMARTSEMAWLAWLPWPFLLYGFYLAFGHLLHARLEWDRVHYVITDRRLLVQRGLLKACVESMALGEITYFRLDRHAEELGTLQVHQGREKKLILHCIEHPRRATDLLEAAMGANRPA